ncbi:secondary thiamine-phosphate synthase enzyme [Desulfonatronum thiosulfatophilum]|uniref:Secondary thiamine-phosphate synthase enzyme n=1 Tax=Desulfonatronum thiosulfatophilum TaxID=617002 RepID=A0A1G6BCQ9_9BACT|nr:secondary thiamine-phosphate synthase enzyme YjbQ [Desulfonatronum thiosulfatophilum]SDB18408.1 secondary thiamine-phosphate synthase enzyme [Desulfonatronum thiosulfatophilum]
MHELSVQTPQREFMVDITAQVQDFVRNRELRNGMVILFCPHTTAGLTINENADPTVTRDILTTLRRLIPHQGDYQHAEGNSDAHVKAGLMGSDLRILVEEGRLMLGMWQGIFLTEFDGPRSRKVWIQWFASSTAA